MLHTTPDDMFELMLKVHNTAPFRLIKEVAPYMRSKDPKDKGKNRSIINVSSTSGCVGIRRETFRLDCACAGADQLIGGCRDRLRTACTETSDRSVPPPCTLHSRPSLLILFNASLQANYATAKAGIIGLTKTCASPPFLL